MSRVLYQAFLSGVASAIKKASMRMSSLPVHSDASLFHTSAHCAAAEVESEIPPWEALRLESISGNHCADVVWEGTPKAEQCREKRLRDKFQLSLHARRGVISEVRLSSGDPWMCFTRLPPQAIRRMPSIAYVHCVQSLPSSCRSEQAVPQPHYRQGHPHNFILMLVLVYGGD